MSLQELRSILTRLRSEDDRWDAIIDLKIKGDPTWVAPLIENLNDPDWIVRWSIAEKLGDLGDPKAIRPLLKCLIDKDFHVSKNALKSLKRFNTETIHDAVKLFGHKNVYLRKKVYEFLKGLGEPAIPVLRKELEAQDWIVSNRIVHLIWDIGQAQSENVLISCLSYPFVQKNTIVLLGMLKSMPALPHFIKIYEQKPSSKRVIFYALKLIGKQKAFPVIVDALNNSALSSAAEALIIKIGPAMLPYILEKLTIPNPSTDTLLKLLVKLGPEKVINTINKIAETDKEFARLTKEIRRKYPQKTAKDENSSKFFGLF